MFDPKIIFRNFLFKRFKRFKGTIIVRTSAHKPIESKMSTSSQGFLLSCRWQWCGPSPPLMYLTTPTTPLALLSLWLASRAWSATFWSYTRSAGGPCCHVLTCTPHLLVHHLCDCVTVCVRWAASHSFDIDPLLHWSACPVFLWLDVKFRTYWMMFLLGVRNMLIIWLNGCQVIRSFFSFSIYVTHLKIVGTLMEHGDFFALQEPQPPDTG